MIFIFTLDDTNATQFCGKRQSKDRVVAKDILEFIDSGPIYIKEKTASFFKDEANFIFVNNFENVPEDAICFAEEVISKELLDKAEFIVVYRWNRQYPSLVKDRLNLTDYTKEIIKEFKGSSHDKITVEIYKKGW